MSRKVYFVEALPSELVEALAKADYSHLPSLWDNITKEPIPEDMQALLNKLK